METILSSPTFSPLVNPKPTSPRSFLSYSLQPKSPSLPSTKPVFCSVKKDSSLPQKSPSFPIPSNWISPIHHGLAALALSLALNFSPVLPTPVAGASEFDVINDGPPKETYVVDDAGVLSRVTRSDIKKLLYDLEYRKNFRINFVTVRKLTVSLT